MRRKRLEIGGILAVFVGYISEDNGTDRERERQEPIVITSSLVCFNTYLLDMY